MTRRVSAVGLRNPASHNLSAPLSVSLPFGESVLENLRGSGKTFRTVDLLLLTSTFLFSLSLHYSVSTHFALTAFLQRDISFRSILIGSMCILAWRSILNAVGVYDPIRIRSFSEYLARCIAGSAGCSLVVGLILRVVHSETRVITGLSYWTICLVMMLAARVLLLSFDHSVRQRLRIQRKLLIVGTGIRAVEVYEEMKGNRDLDYSLLGYVDSTPQTGYVAANQVIGTLDQLKAF